MEYLFQYSHYYYYLNVVCYFARTLFLFLNTLPIDSQWSTQHLHCEPWPHTPHLQPHARCQRQDSRWDELDLQLFFKKSNEFIKLNSPPYISLFLVLLICWKAKWNGKKPKSWTCYLLPHYPTQPSSVQEPHQLVSAFPLFKLVSIMCQSVKLLSCLCQFAFQKSF